ncbi:MAG: aminopeptidase P family protein [Actinobacteria bacterium]|nr:MAG: aminopeptidase P family protein [Actinomycetota bacterium]
MNVRYLTGFSGSAGVVLIGAEDVFFTDSRYEEQSAREVPDSRRVIPGPGQEKVTVAEIVAAGIDRLAVETSNVSLAQAQHWREDMPGLHLVETTDVIEELRRVKDATEVDALRRAAAIGDRGLTELLGRLREGMTEVEAAAELEDAMRRAGSEGLSFPTIVAFGENAAEPHHSPKKQRRLRSGDLIKLDFGAMYQGYHSDMTRTIAFGDPDPEMVKIYDIVRSAQEAGVEAVASGATGGSVDEAARSIVEQAGYTFGHGTGHGCGLEVHEAPSIRRGGDDVLDDGMAITVEPGIYLPGRGGVRIEDLVVVSNGGCEVLTRSPRELVRV